MSVNNPKLSQEENSTFQPLSPVFKVYQHKRGKKRKKLSFAQTCEANIHKEDLGSSNIKLGRSLLNEDFNEPSKNCSEIVNFEDDGELLNSSFTQLDKVCNNLLNGKQKSDTSKFSKSFADVFLKKKNRKLHFDYLQFSKSLQVKKQFYAKTIGTKLEQAEYNISDLFLDCFNLLEIVKENDKTKLSSHLHENKLEKIDPNKHDNKRLTSAKNLEIEPIEALQKNNLFSEFHEFKDTNLQVQSKLALELSPLTPIKSDEIDSKILSAFEEFINDENNKFNSKECFATSSLMESAPIKLCENVKKSINNNNNSSSSNNNNNNNQNDADSRHQIFEEQELSISNAEPSKFVGFLTASGMKLSLTKKSLEKANKLIAKWDEFEDFQIKDESSLCEAKLFSNLEEKKEVVGFSTASGMKLSATKESLEKAQKLMSTLDDIEGFPNDDLKIFNTINTDFQNVEATGAVGFSTASGVKLSATKESLSRAQKLMAKWNESEDFQSIHEKSLREAKPLPISNFPNPEPREVLGFSTASGMKLSVTNESLEKAQKLMAESNEREEFEQLDITEIKPSANSAKQSKSRITSTSTPIRKHENILLNGAKAKFSNSFKAYNFLTPLQETKTQNSFTNMSLENHDKTEYSSLPDKENNLKTDELDVFHSSIEKSHSCASKAIKKGLKRCPLEFDTPTKKIKYLGEATNFNISEEIFNVQEKRAVARFNQEIIIEEKGNVNSVKGSLLTKKNSLHQTKKKTLIDKLFSVSNITEDMFINLSDAANYKFVGSHFFGPACTENVNGFLLDDFFNIIPDDENNFGVEEFKRGFLAGPGVQPNLIPKGWIENHYKWIVWKLVYYKNAFQNCLLNVLTPNNVMLQLKYRYDREIDGSERSALKKILEKDDTSVRRLVLRICEIKKIFNSNGLEYELHLSDGWYSCPAKIDLAMVRLIEKGKIKVGMKIIIQGASLHNCEQGMSPLEITKDVYLRICSNSTRPAKVNAKLGFQKNPGHLTIPLSSLLPDGGQISSIKIILVRLYPLLYMEKMPNGRYVVRNRRSEERADLEYKRMLEKKTEVIYDEVRLELEKGVANKKSKLVLYHSQENESLDRFKLSDSQELRKELTAMVEEKLKKCLVKRNVTQFLRLKIVDLKNPNFTKPASLTVWNPNEEIIKCLSEGKGMSITNVNFGNSFRNFNQIQLNTTKQTQFRELIKNCNFPARHLTSFESINSNFAPDFNEVDLVGITLIKNFDCSSETTRNIFLVDLDLNFIRITCAGNYEDHCWKNVLSHGSIIACSNLYWNGNVRRQEIPVFFVTETTVFTENPKHFHLKAGLQKLRESLPKEFHSFMSICEMELIKKLYK